MALHETLNSPTLAAAAVVLLVFLVLYVTFQAFALVGFTPGEVVTLIFIAPFVSWINIPIFERPGLIVAVNIAGVVIPTILVLRFLYQERLPVARTAIVTVIVAAVAFLLSTPTDQGILVLVYPIVLVTVVVTAVATRARPGVTGPVAFTAGSMGTLIGADVMHLGQLSDPSRAEPLVGSIGGAGTLDAIYLVGLLAVVVEIGAVTMAWLVRRAASRSR